MNINQRKDRVVAHLARNHEEYAVLFGLGCLAMMAGLIIYAIVTPDLPGTFSLTNISMLVR